MGHVLVNEADMLINKKPLGQWVGTAPPLAAYSMG